MLGLVGPCRPAFGLWCLFQACRGLFVPLPFVAASVVGLPGCSLSAFSFPFRADPGCCQGRGCVGSLLFLVEPPSFSCVCVWRAVVHQTRNALKTLPALRRSLLCLLCRLLLFSPPPLASCFLPHPCCCCCPSFVVFGSFPVVLLLGWVGHSFIFMVIFHLNDPLRKSGCVCVCTFCIEVQLRSIAGGGGIAVVASANEAPHCRSGKRTCIGRPGHCKCSWWPPFFPSKYSPRCFCTIQSLVRATALIFLIKCVRACVRK